MEAETIRAERVSLQVVNTPQVERLLEVLASIVVRILDGDDEDRQRVGERD